MKSLGITLAVLSALVLSADGPALAGTDATVELYGYIKADAIYDMGRMNAAWSSTMRPSQIIIQEADSPYYDEGEFIFSLRASRVGANFQVVGAERPLTGQLEVDFFGVGSNAGQQMPRLRQMYVSYGKFLFGQTWSLFNDTDIWPVTMDFWGPCGLLASRRPQLRFTVIDTDHRQLAFALEQPGAGIDEGKGPQYDPDLDVRPRSVLPDLTAQFKVSGRKGYVQLAGVVRQLGYEGTIEVGGESVDFTNSVMGWGGYLSGRWLTAGRSGLAGSVAFGEGISNYMNDGGVDAAPDIDPDLNPGEVPGAESVPLLGWHVSYDAFWNARWSTSLGASQTIQDNTAGQLDDAFKTGTYTFINLVYRPEPNLSYGLEFLWGERENKDGLSQDAARFDLAVKYAF